MRADDELSRKLEDFQRDPSYERRVVAFYDFLGWREKISDAGTDPAKIGKLRRMILRHTRSLAGQQQYAAPAVRFSSFSDNVVVSNPTTNDAIIHLLGTLCAFQLVSAADGFLVRGGVTVGDIYHDTVSVFGPALNRAYHLESQVADVPRIVVDPVVLDVLGGAPYFVTQADGVIFLDPFTSRFVDQLKSMEPASGVDVYATLGMPRGRIRHMSDAPTSAYVKFAFDGVKALLQKPLADREWAKVAWVYDRLAKELGVPPARSYPRLRPGS